MEFIILHVNGVGKVLPSLPAVYWVFIDKKIRTLLFAHTLPFPASKGPAVWSCTSCFNGANLPQWEKRLLPPSYSPDHYLCQILSCAWERKQSKKQSSQQKNHFSLSPSFWIQHARVQCCYQALWSSPFPRLWFMGRAGVGSPLTHRHKAVPWKWQWWLADRISKPIL